MKRTNINDELYKKACTNYILSTGNEILVSKDNLIKTAIVEDGANKTDINFENINDYAIFDVYTFSSFEELYFDGGVSADIFADIGDIGLYDSEKRWEFYLSRDDLIELGFEEVIINEEKELEIYNNEKETDIQENHSILEKKEPQITQENITLSNRIGSWYILQEAEFPNIAGKFYMLEHEEYGDEAEHLIMEVKSNGDVYEITDEYYDFGTFYNDIKFDSLTTIEEVRNKYNDLYGYTNRKATTNLYIKDTEKSKQYEQPKNNYREEFTR